MLDPALFAAERSLVGTEPDFDEWVAARGQSLLRLAFVLTGAQQDAEDVVQDALSRALPRWSRIAGRPDLETHVRRLVVEAHGSRWRRWRRFRRGEGAATLVTVGPTTGISIGDPDLVWRACRSLPEDQRTAVVLRFYEDLELAEIAELTGVREGVVGSRVSRGVTALRSELEERDD